MIILTGFGPFGKYSRNLSSQIVKEFPNQIAGFQLIRENMSVSWKESISQYKIILSELEFKPDLVILLGIHAKMTVDLEVYGWNFMVGSDEENKFKFGPIKLLAPPWIKTPLNIKKIYAALENKTEIVISYFPGFYLCNYLYFWALYLSKKEYPVIFIHIPPKADISEYVHKVKIIIKSIIKIHLNNDLDI